MSDDEEARGPGAGQVGDGPAHGGHGRTAVAHGSAPVLYRPAEPPAPTPYLDRHPAPAPYLDDRHPAAEGGYRVADDRRRASAGPSRGGAGSTEPSPGRADGAEPPGVRSAPVSPERTRPEHSGQPANGGAAQQPERPRPSPWPRREAPEPGHRRAVPPPSGRTAPTWNPQVLGTPTVDFEPRPPASASYRPDVVADGWSTRDFVVRAASVRGYAHRHRGTPRQDDISVAVHQPSGAVVFAVADGVSEARQSHIGATGVCRAAVGAILADLDATGWVDWQNVVQQAAWQLVEQARVVLELAELDQAAAEKAMATTLVAGMVLPGGPTVSLIQVGDSSAWVLRGRSYRCLLDTKVRTDEAVVSSAVTALPRVPRVTPRTGQLGPDEVLLVGTDGFGDPLGDGEGEVGSFFATRLSSPQPPLEFAYSLDFSRETYDDDRTLLAVWPRLAK
ncbi:protein phosphatase 2C domain-containing protein [Micromonospora sp. DT233]|uniref:protein phosphatase 2C domain-containing protein n=1 Tax=Micromonospora sp. DT233 TaxID=3393432 RepID=UPI003CF576B6